MKQVSLKTFDLKCISVSMMIVGEVLRQLAYQFTVGKEVEPLLWQNVLYHFGYFLYLGAFPLAAFLLVEGVKKTSHKRLFLNRIFLAGIVVEFPLDIAFHGFEGSEYWGYQQNYFFTLFLGLCAICLVEKIGEYIKVGSFLHNIIAMICYVIASLVAMLFQLEQGGLGILVIFALYMFYGNCLASLLSVMALYFLFFTGVGIFAVIPALSLLLLWLYQGEEGKKTRTTRLCCYFSYPVVYIVLRLLGRML